MNRKLLLSLGVLIVILVVVALGFWFATSRPPLQKWALPDGSELSVRKVTYGRKHELGYGSGWNDHLFRLLPPGLALKLGATVAVHNTTQTNGIVVWLQRKNAPTLPAPGVGFFAPVPDLRVTVVDEQGVETAEFNQVFFGRGSFWGFQLVNYPRRSPEIIIRTYVQGTRNFSRVGDFKIPNPWPHQSPAWVPDSLPASRSTNGLEISLIKLEVRPADPQDSRPSALRNRAIFKILEKDKSATNWSIAKIHARAPTGESFDPGSYGGGWSRGEFNFRFQGAFWSEEPAWKILVEAWRTADFPADELWTVKGIGIPGPQQLVEVHTKTNIYGAEVELLGVAAQGATLPRGWQMGGFGGSTLHVRLAASAAYLHLTLVKVMDDQARSVEITGIGYGGSAPNELHYGFGLKIPDGAKSLDVTVAVSKVLTVEFQTKPEVVK